MLFFQAGLLTGYLYAHWLASKPEWARWVHVALLGASLAFLPLGARAELWKPDSASNPSLRILVLLAVTVGVPYFMLASTAPLVQRLFHRDRPRESPWRLYALSNLASFAALLSYPFLIEPFLRLRTQARVWSVVYVGFVAASAWTVMAAGRESKEAIAGRQATRSPVPLLWLALSFAASVLLLATTSQISQEVAVVPFLWIAPLSIYLLTFVLAFADARWYNRPGFGVAAGLLATVACAVLAATVALPVWTQIAVDLAALFAASMVCHGELVRARPAPEHLTAFYLVLAAGGALGGVFTALIAPRLFTGFTEYPLGLAAACMLGIAAWARDGGLKQWTNVNLAVRIPMMALLLGGLTSAATAITNRQPAVAAVRNFYGILRVSEIRDAQGRTVRELTHGRIKHGSQFVDAALHEQPTSYYGPHSGVALALQALARENPAKPLRVAVVGLGAGTLAAWGRPGDTFRFYEINPAVANIASQWFSYLRDSKSRTEIALGDARVTLERELAAGARHDFNGIAVDAFSSDSIPLHLLTAECAEIYRQRLTTDGALLLHISNRSLNLEPVARGLARAIGDSAMVLPSNVDRETGEDSATWVAITANRTLLEELAPHTSGSGPRPSLLWTDDFASLWHVLK
jgi:spermidine synthase